MKRKGLIVAGAALLLLASGCGEKTGEDTVSVNVENIPIAAQEEEDPAQEGQSTVNESDNDESGTGPAAIQETAELLGNVVSVGDNSAVVSKNFTEELEDGKGDIMWAPAEGREVECGVGRTCRLWAGREGSDRSLQWCGSTGRGGQARLEL